MDALRTWLRFNAGDAAVEFKTVDGLYRRIDRCALAAISIPFSRHLVSTPAECFIAVADALMDMSPSGCREAARGSHQDVEPLFREIQWMSRTGQPAM